MTERPESGPYEGASTPVRVSRRRDWLDWHASGMMSALLVSIWWYLLDAVIARPRHLPSWIPRREDVIFVPAATCALLGMYTIWSAIARRRYLLVLEGLIAVAVGLVGCVIVTFLFVFES